MSYNSRDLLIYALGIGCCGRDDGQPGDADMRYLYEGHPNFSAFPTYALALPFKGTSSDLVPFPGMVKVGFYRVAAPTADGSACDSYPKLGPGAVKPFFFNFAAFFLKPGVCFLKPLKCTRLKPLKCIVHAATNSHVGILFESVSAPKQTLRHVFPPGFLETLKFFYKHVTVTRLEQGLLLFFACSFCM